MPFFNPLIIYEEALSTRLRAEISCTWQIKYAVLVRTYTNRTPLSPVFGVNYIRQNLVQDVNSDPPRFNSEYCLIIQFHLV
jgi:hypothetical protein